MGCPRLIFISSLWTIHSVFFLVASKASLAFSCRKSYGKGEKGEFLLNSSQMFSINLLDCKTPIGETRTAGDSHYSNYEKNQSEEIGVEIANRYSSSQPAELVSSSK